MKQEIMFIITLAHTLWTPSGQKLLPEQYANAQQPRASEDSERSAPKPPSPIAENSKFKLIRRGRIAQLDELR